MHKQDSLAIERIRDECLSSCCLSDLAVGFCVCAQITLNCRHRYHEFCIRGWIIVGKKDTCPYCNEKVDLKSTFTTPWEKTSIVWANLLDMVRYLVVWNPIIIMVTQAILLAMGFTPGALPVPWHLIFARCG